MQQDFQYGDYKREGVVSGLEMTGGFVFKSSRLKYCKAMLALINTFKTKS